MNQITLLTTSIAVLGGVLFIILLARLFQVGRAGNLNRHRNKDEAVSDLLNWASVVDNGIVLNKNGSLMASWMYVAEDSDNATDEEKDYTCVKLNQAFAKLGSGWMAHFDSIRVESAKYSDSRLNSFPDRVTYALDEERRRFFMSSGAMYEGAHCVTLTYFPPLLAQAKFVELLFDDDERQTDPQSRAAQILRDFKHQISNFESELSSVVKMSRLQAHEYEYEDGSIHKHDEQLQYLHYCLTGIVQPIILPDNPSYLDQVIGGQELWGGVIPRIGRKYIQVVAIEGFPSESYAGILSRLSDVPIECRFSSRFIFMDRHQALAAANKQKKKWKQKERGIADTLLNRPITPDRLNQDAVAMVADATEAIKEIEEGEVAYGYYTALVILKDEDRERLEGLSRELAKEINNLGFAARVETINCLDAFMGSLPGHGVENVRRPHISTLSFAHFVPTSSIWTGSSTAPCPFYPPASPPLMHCVTQGNTPYRLNLHVGDVGHTIIAGRTGGGKSTLMTTLMAQAMRYPGNTIFGFDKGMSMFPLCAGAGGSHFDIASEKSTLCFAPFTFLETANDRQWALDWVDKMLALNNFTTGPAERNEIADALERAAQANKAGHPTTFDDFLGLVQSNAIREALRQYGIEGMMGTLLAAEQDGLNLSRLTVFEVEKLMDLGDKWSLPVLDYLFRRIQVALRGQPAWLFLDEAWLMLQHPVFASKIREWLKVLRKANCAVVLATQNLDDFAGSSIFTEIVQSTASKIFLPNVHARNEDTADVYKRMGLNNQQINIIAKAEAKRHYYHVTEDGKRLFELALGPIARCFVAASDKESIAAIQKLQEKYGENWPEIWVRERTGLELKDYYAGFAA